MFIYLFYFIYLFLLCIGSLQFNNPKLIYKLRKGKFRIVELQAQINYIRFVRVCNLYVYFFVTSMGFLVVVHYLFGWV